MFEIFTENNECNKTSENNESNNSETGKIKEKKFILKEKVKRIEGKNFSSKFEKINISKKAAQVVSNLLEKYLNIIE